ncbi:MAG: phosphoglycerate kinase [Marinilabiliales bacterium]|nr:MAG: phosphoglycerate kinase [Marinilabiliales bacterium]
MKTAANYDFNGKRALIRVDFNVPLNSEFQITDPTRINAAMPTINKIIADGGSVVLMSHLGRPKEGPEDKFSMKHLIPYLKEVTGKEVKFGEDCIGEEAFELSANLQPGEILLLNNLRFYKEETKGNEEFAQKLAKHGDVYVNDAFGTAHRAHASTTIVAQYFAEGEKMFGLLLGKEIEAMDKVLKESKRPFTAILGGAKVSGKIQIIENLLEKADNIIIGGGMMFSFVKALGGKIGNSLVEDDYLELARMTMKKAADKNINIYIPVDAIEADAFDNNANRKEVAADAIDDNWMGLDIGAKSMADIEEILMESETILWNGPMGVFEMENFAAGTRFVAETVAKATANGAFSLIGGGDSVAAINKYELKDKVSYVSTGGGAMLEYIEGKELPGIKAIRG